MTDSDRVTSAASHVRAMSERLGEGHDMCAYTIIAAVRPLLVVRNRAESCGTNSNHAEQIRHYQNKFKITGKTVPTDWKN